MKNKMFIDLGRMMDDIFEAAQSFGEAVHEEFTGSKKGRCYRFHWDENVDYYPTYSYPPANVYMTEDKSLHFEFALAGFNGDKVNLEFNGDYMILNAEPAPSETVEAGKEKAKAKTAAKEKAEDTKASAEKDEKEDASAPKRKYLKRRLKFKAIVNQKYYVPADKFDQEKVTAAFKNGILKVAISPKEGYKKDEGIKVDIETEEEK